MKIFSSNLDQNKFTINVKEIDTSELNAEVIRIFNQFGFCLLSYPIALNPNEFISISEKLIGPIDKRHSRSDNLGITEIKESEGFINYVGSTNKKHEFHTDGPFESPPPEVFALYCSTPSLRGGETLIHSSKNIIEQCNLNTNELLDQYITFSRGKDNAMNPILLINNQGNFSLNYRFDKNMQISASDRGIEILKTISNHLNNSADYLKDFMEKQPIAARR